jgi:hypothetical protein
MGAGGPAAEDPTGAFIGDECGWNLGSIDVLRGCLTSTCAVAGVGEELATWSNIARSSCIIGERSGVVNDSIPGGPYDWKSGLGRPSLMMGMYSRLLRCSLDHLFTRWLRDGLRGHGQ